MMGRLHRAYDRLWRPLTRVPRAGAVGFAVVAFAVMAIIGASIFPQAGQAVTPDFKERDVLLQWEAGRPGPRARR